MCNLFCFAKLTKYGFFLSFHRALSTKRLILAPILFVWLSRCISAYISHVTALVLSRRCASHPKATGANGFQKHY